MISVARQELPVLAVLRLEFDAVVLLLGDRADALGAVLHLDDVPLVQSLDLFDDRVVFFPLGAVDDVGEVGAAHALVRRNGDHVQLVDLPEFGGLGHGRAGHAADLVVELEEVLQRDRGVGLRLFLDAHALFGLDGLVQPVAPLPAGHQAAGELVDDDDLVPLDDVVHVELVQVMGLQRVIDQVRPVHVAGRVESLDAGQLFGLAHAVVGQVGRVFFFFDLEVHVFLQLPGNLVGLGIARDVVVGRAGDDQRRAGLVDQDVVDLVDDRVSAVFAGTAAGSSDSDRRRRRPASCCRGGSRSRTRCSCRT